MALTLPSLAPTGYALDYTDFFRTKVERSGAIRRISGTVSVPSGTASGTLVGLFPFNKGFNMQGARVYCQAMDTGTTQLVDVGYIYYDSATGSSVPGAFVSASTAAQSGGGNINFTGASAVSGMLFDALGDGWVTLRIAAQSTLTTGIVTYSCAIDYDTSGVTN